MNIRLGILIFFIIIFLFSGCNSSKTKYSALYFTTKNSSINIENLKEKNILAVNTFNDLKSTLKSISYKIGIIIDKSALEDNNQIASLNQWLLEQKGNPIIVAGYGNPTYVYFNKLTLNKNKPKFSEEKIEEFKKMQGFSLAYICEDGKILGKGYDKLDINEILKVLNDCSKGKKYIEEMVGEKPNHGGGGGYF